MPNLPRVLLLAVCVGFPNIARAQVITTVVETGVVLPGVGTVTGLSGFAVSDAGSVRARAYANNLDPTLGDTLVDENGLVVYRAGDALPAPPGAVIWNFGGGNMTMHANGTLVVSLETLGSPGTDQAVYFGSPLALALATPSVATTARLTPGSIINFPLWPKINSSSQICFASSVDDPLIPGHGDTNAIFMLDPTTATQDVIVRTGDMLPGQSFAVWELNMNRHSVGFNDSGNVIYSGNTYADPNVQRFLYFNLSKIAQQSDPSPFGSTYVSFSSVSLNDTNDYAYRCHLNDVDAQDGIVVNNIPFVQVGEMLPGFAPFKLDYIGTPLFLCNDGSTFWSGSWILPDGTSSIGIFRDYAMVVATGATVVHGAIVQAMPATLDAGFSVSSSGQYLIFQATLQGGTNGIYLIDLWQ
jgi:hypothetical protein